MVSGPAFLLENSLEQALASVLGHMTVRAWELPIDTPNHGPTVSEIRGVWGSMLRSISTKDYDDIFGEGPHRRPRYILRPARRKPIGRNTGAEARGPYWHFLLFGDIAQESLANLWRAWELAGCQGLGRERTPFFLDDIRPLAWDATRLSPSRLHPGFALFPLPSRVNRDQPCQVVIRSPLRMFHKSRPITTPSLLDLTVGALRRVMVIVGEEAARAIAASQPRWLDIARSIPAERFVGRSRTFSRWSSSQNQRIDMDGVIGSLVLPCGAGPLLPLLTAAQWLHVGKATVFGLGELALRPLGGEGPRRR